jgi:hypothetical protein
MSGISTLPPPTDLRDYLKTQGWSLLEQAISDRMYVLESQAFPRRQLVFPMDVSAPDYADSVQSVLQKVSELSGSSITDLLPRINFFKDDVVRLRVHSGNISSTLPLCFASTLVCSTEKLLRSSACTVLRPRTHHPRLSLTEAAQFVDKARFCQTESGSYIIQVACKLNGVEAQGALDPDGHEPFVRMVTQTLSCALTKLVTAIEMDTLDAFVEDLRASTSPLISSNLCDALVGMHDDEIDNSLDVTFSWSALRPSTNAEAKPLIRLQRDYFSRIDEVRRELRSMELNDVETFIGTVERLDGEMSPDGKRSGTVLLALLLPGEGETVRARTTLNADEYAVADRAHMINGAYIRITGRLKPGRQPQQITEMIRFELVPGCATEQLNLGLPG